MSIASAVGQVLQGNWLQTVFAELDRGRKVPIQITIPKNSRGKLGRKRDDDGEEPFVANCVSYREVAYPTSNCVEYELQLDRYVRSPQDELRCSPGGRARYRPLGEGTSVPVVVQLA